MLKLKRLTIHKFPRVKPGTELVFNDGFNVLLGVNGSGKTTLLKLLTYLISGELLPLKESEFHLAYHLEREEETCTYSIQYFPPGRPGGSQPDNITHSELIFHRPGQTDRVTIKGDVVSVTQDDVTQIDARRAGTSPLLPRLADELVLRAKLSHFYATDRLDESTRWLDRVTDSAHLEAIEPYIWDPRSTQSAFERFICEYLRRSSEQDVHQIDASHLPFLQRAATLLGCTSASLQFQLKQKERVEPHEFFRYAFGDFRFRFVKADGTRLTHHELSYGQQRLLAFHYYAAMHPKIIVADELTNGLHHAMIDQCIGLIGGRQAFLATQNPLLLDNLPGFTSVDEVHSTFILCSTERENGREQMVWRNMTVDEAENFYRDYKVGISHVNDILRSWGLW